MNIQLQQQQEPDNKCRANTEPTGRKNSHQMKIKRAVNTAVAVSVC